MLSVALGCHSWTVHRPVAHSFQRRSPAWLAGDRFSGVFQDVLRELATPKCVLGRKFVLAVLA